jgi:hypothetical protein
MIPDDDDDVEDVEDDDEDEEEEDKGDEVEAKDEEHKSGKQNFKLRAKKFLCTKTAQTKLGRKAIAHFLGEEGNKLLGALKSSALKEGGKKRAATVKLLIFKMALKGKVLSDAGLIKKKDVWLLTDPINSLALKLYEAVKPQPNCVDVAPLVVEIAKVRDMILNLMRQHVSKSNLDKLDEVMRYIGGQPFLHQFMNSDKFENEKRTVFQSMRILVQPILKDRRFDDQMQELCILCQEFAVESSEGFQGSSYCLVHHDERVQAFLKAPSLRHFLDGDGKDYFPFQAAVKKDVERYIRKLWLCCEAYRQAKPHLRGVFADELWRKYLKRGSQHHVPVPELVLANIEPRLPSREETVFDELEQNLFERMDIYFQQDFLPSELFQDYVKAYSLPAYLAREHRAALAAASAASANAKKSPKRRDSDESR